MSFAASGIAIAALTAFTPSPTDQNVWQDFQGRISVHARALAFNAVGVAAAFAYSPDQSETARREAVAEGDATPWEHLVSQTLDARAVPRIAIGLLVLAATFACARSLPQSYAMFLGFPLLFASAPPRDSGFSGGW